MRLDKYLAHAGVGTRKEVKKLIRGKAVRVNGEIVRNDDFKINENEDEVYVYDEPIFYQEFYYVMLNKPNGYVSATMDDRDPTVLDLIYEDFAFALFPVGRLDKDTEGLLLITNDGELSHNLLSPKKHVDKTYLVKTAEMVTQDMIQALEKGVDIGEEKLTLPAKVKQIDVREIELTITEGKFHQVKRMLKAVGNEVVYLKRLSMGSLKLDEELKLGEYRSLTESEIEALKNR